MRNQSGRALLQLTDNVGFGANGAGWIYNKDRKAWVFLLITGMIDQKGPRWIYDRLLSVFEKLSLPAGISPLDIMIVSPRETKWAALPSGVRVDDGANLAYINNLRVEGFRYDNIVLYRMNPAPQNTSAQAAIFDRRVAELTTA